jgi:DNA-binding protein H-NS
VNILYRIYSKILTDKVNITNQRAKRVEETLDQLQRAKNELQEINAQMERRVVERTQALQTKLQELLSQHLAPPRPHRAFSVSKQARRAAYPKPRLLRRA